VRIPPCTPLKILLTNNNIEMKKQVIYLLMAAVGTVGFTGCGSGQNTSPDRTGTYGTATGTEMGTQTTQDRTGTTVGTTGNQTATTGTSGTRTTTGMESGTTSNTGQRTGDVSNNSNMSTTAQTGNTFRLNQATDYSYNNENFRFTPDQRGISITRDQSGTQSPFGTMRSFGNDGYYMVTTTNAAGEEEFSVGRFDERGNFTIYRYDRNGDRVTEQNYRSNTPVNQNNR